MTTLASQYPQNRPSALRSYATRALVLAAALSLAACTTPVKLDKPAVSTGGASSMPSSDASSGAAGAESAVKSVVVGSGSKTPLKLGDLPTLIYFDYDSYEVKPDGLPTVEGYAEVLKANPSQRMVLEGHTDERGGREYNLALGQKRAEAVLRALTVLGASGEQLEPVSLGEEQPAAQGSDESAWSKNRRVEFRVR